MVLQNFLRRAYFCALKTFSLETVYCLGDSHIRVFNHPLFKWVFPILYFDITAVNGATASGLKNKDSKTQAGKIFENKIQSISPGGTIIFCLGEVDCGNVIWRRAEKKELPVEDMLEEAVSNYVDIIQKTSIRHRVIVISAPLPTIGDGAPVGEVAMQRRGIKASQQERTQLTLKFNHDVATRVQDLRRVDYVNLDGVSLDPVTGLVQDGLKNPNKTNHHYHKARYARILAKALSDIL